MHFSVHRFPLQDTSTQPSAAHASMYKADTPELAAAEAEARIVSGGQAGMSDWLGDPGQRLDGAAKAEAAPAMMASHGGTASVSTAYTTTAPACSEGSAKAADTAQPGPGPGAVKVGRLRSHGRSGHLLLPAAFVLLPTGYCPAVCRVPTPLTLCG